MTEKARNKVKISAPRSSNLYTIAQHFLKMAGSYIKDAKYFKN